MENTSFFYTNHNRGNWDFFMTTVDKKRVTLGIHEGKQSFTRTVPGILRTQQRNHENGSKSF